MTQELRRCISLARWRGLGSVIDIGMTMPRQLPTSRAANLRRTRAGVGGAWMDAMRHLAAAMDQYREINGDAPPPSSSSAEPVPQEPAEQGPAPQEPHQP